MRYLFVLLLTFLVGCGANSPVPIKGKVTLDEKPLAEGRVSFIIPGQVPILLDVKDGEFTGKVKPGDYRVEIAAFRPYRIPSDVPKSMHALMADSKENYLPARYHSESTLQVKVESSGENSFEFPLDSRAK